MLKYAATVIIGLLGACDTLDTAIAKERAFCEVLGYKSDQIEHVQCVERGTRARMANQKAVPTAILIGAAAGLIVTGAQ